MIASDKERLNFGDIDLTSQAMEIVRSVGYCRILNVPADALEFVKLTSGWGEPLEYYGTGSIGQHPDHPAIHQVRFEPDAAKRGELHALQGALGLHSAQTMRDPRPRFFSMLMIDPGWSDIPGANGESIIASWSKSLAKMRETCGALRFEELLCELTKPQPLPDGGQITIAYPLDQQRSDVDLGVRMKYGLAEYWAGHSQVDQTASDALQTLSDAAAQISIEIQLEANELIVFDNDRWAHGRREVRGRREGVEGEELNPRELWSVTLA